MVPGCVRTLAKNETVQQLRNPQASGPWQHVFEPLLAVILTLAKELHEKREFHSEPFNFGSPASQNHSVQELVQTMSKH